MSTNNNGNSTGSGQTEAGYSVSAFLTSLVTNIIIWSVEIGLFIVLRTVFKRIYQPRTFVETVSKERRVEPLPATPWGWIPKILTTPTHLVIGKSGLDGYFLLRYLRMMLILFGGSMLIIWPILLPINAVNQRGSAGGITGMDLLSISNVSNPKRYWAHVIMAILLAAATCYLMYHELLAFIRIRQENLTSDEHKDTVRATTILVTSVPENFLNAATLRQVFSVFPGGVRNVFLNRDCSDLLNEVELRDKISKLLEAGETQLIIDANKNHRKAMKKREKELKKKGTNAEEVGSREAEGEAEQAAEDQEYLVDKYVPKKKRPTYRVPLANWMPSLPLIGKKVDKVKWARERLSRLNPEIARRQSRLDLFDPMNSAFIQFNTQLAAHMACQSVASHHPMYMTPRYIETAPEDVVWGNMQLVWWQRLIRIYAINGAIGALLVFYSIPTAFVGSVSNLTYLTNLLPWLRWIYNLPSQLLGIITGLLPSVMLAIWMSLLPFILRIACRFQGYPTRTVIELAVQNMYFAFEVIQVFLVVSIASSSTAVVTQIIANPTNVATILAANLPKASNFFFSYLLLQGLSVSAGTLLQIATLLLYYVFSKLFDSTPRKKWTRFNSLPGMGWGTTYPVFTNLAVIGLSYAIISPLIMIFVITTFSLFYFTYLYNFLYVYEFTTDTGGLSFPKAIHQTFTGLYFGEVCLIGLFFITNGARAQGVVMIVVLCLTILAQYQLTVSFDPLITYLPIDIQEELLHKVEEQKEEEGRDTQDEEKFKIQQQTPEPQAPSQEEKLPRHSQGTTSSAEASPPQLGKMEFESPDSTTKLREAEFTGEDKIHPAALQEWGNKIVHRVNTVTGKINIPGITKKKVRELDEDEDVDTGLARKHTRELTRDELTALAFQHEAVRARPPILWIPDDELGIAKDEIYHTEKETNGEVQMTTVGASLDTKGKIVWLDNPPDYAKIPTI